MAEIFAKSATRQMHTAIAKLKEDGKLNLSFTGLLEIPSLPEGVRELKIHHTKITTLPPLPESLEVLDLYENTELNSLPPLPPGLRVLKVVLSQLTSLPLIPPGLLVLDCGFNSLSELPELPPTLQVLNCSGSKHHGGYLRNMHVNKIRKLAPLPPELRRLECSGIFLKYLPFLPPKLEYLDCTENFLQFLPEIPPSLKILRCEHNRLEAIPFLPDRIEYVNFHENPLKPPYNEFWGRVWRDGFSFDSSNLRFFHDFYGRRTLDTFKNSVNDYYPIFLIKSRGKNLAAFQQTMGREGATLLRRNAAGAVVNELPLPAILSGKSGPASVVGSFLTGKSKSMNLNTQKAALIGNLPPTGGRRKSTRKRNHRHRKYTRKY